MATIRKRGDAWVLNWSDAAGQHRISLGKITEAEAQARLHAHQARVDGRIAAAGPLFRDWAVRYCTWHKSEYPDSYFRVHQIMHDHLIPRFGDLPLLAITREGAEQYKHDRLAAGAAPGTVTKEMRTLQASLNHAVAWKAIPSNPIHGVKPPRDLASRPPRWYTRDELATLYRVELEIPRCTTPEDHAAHHVYRWAWQLLVNTGLRRGEAQHLKWHDVGRAEVRVLSTAECRTKSGRYRIVPIGPGAARAIDELRANGGPWVLPPMRPESLSRAFARTAERAGIDGSIHCLRHTFCSHLVAAGLPLRAVQILAGHASFATTEKYAHLAPGYLSTAVSGLDL